MYLGYLTDVKGVEVGHFEDLEALTGVTVVLPPEGSVCGVDVRGGAPGTRETDLLRPENFVNNIHGILLAGGSAFGLDAASGVMKYLEEKDIGLDVGVARVPIVPGAVIFDLGCGDSKVRPDFNMDIELVKKHQEKKIDRELLGLGLEQLLEKF
ncbi:Peptidase family S58 [Anaerosphaera aminiphila DSM 21120]|uniref:Peptidase family S58 n=1 Tax=Anaerosphaera aminiphila DSM 21120 TaxID=1120995 RepID=A0A1M5PN10_9FIRM|nr:Peptidase family S58 [Anaerosphaera aminiphila DSM 21120]